MAPMNARLLRPTASGATHPDARDWATRVTANGGTVSSTTLAAVSKFCAAINAAGIRDRFARLNLFCGNSDASLNAVRTPLYIADSLGGSNFGDAMDANNNFVAGDYAQTGSSGGLTGNGTNKSLDTGFIPSNLTFSDSHFSIYGANLASPTTSFRTHGSRTRGSTPLEQFVLQLRAGGNLVNLYAANNSNSTNASASAAQGALENGHVLGTSIASNDHRMFGNGTQLNNSTTNLSGPLNAVAVHLYVLNQSGSLSEYVSSTLSAYSIGKGLTSTQAAAYYTALHAFQTTLGRNK
jgi:hypothetical protein